MTYTEQYKHPEWQKKRLHVLEASGFKCAECGESQETLHVHHLRYVSGRKVWEYEISELRCLCEGCHGMNHELQNLIKEAVGMLSLIDKEMVYAFIQDIEIHGFGWYVDASLAMKKATGGSHGENTNDQA